MNRLPAHAVGIPGATVSFRASLTATSNPFLRDRLPIEGLVQIGERGVDGSCTRVLFMPLDRDPTSFVSVPDAEFTFRSRT